MTDSSRETLLNITARIGYDKIKELVSEIREDGALAEADDHVPRKTDDEYVLEIRDIYQWILNASRTIDRVAPER